MKLSTTVLALAIAATESKTAKKNKTAKTKKHKGLGRKTGSNNNVKTTPIECDLAFAQASASFGSALTWQSEDGGYSGYIDAHNYPNDLNCYINIQATNDPVNCKNIKAKVAHAGIESANTEGECAWDWFNFNDETTKRCGCSGGTQGTDGCLDSMFDDYAEFQEYPEYYYTMEYYEYEDYGNHGRTTLLPGNSFKFNMHSDSNWAGGNVRIEWECTDEEELTTTTATTTTTDFTTHWYPDYESTTTEPYTTTSYPNAPSTTTEYTTEATTTYPAPGGGGYDTTWSSTTTTDYTTTEGVTTSGPDMPTGPCTVRMVYTNDLCENGEWPKTDFVGAKYYRYATLAEVSAQRSNWKSKMGTWYIVGFYNGYANGPGYGSQIKQVNSLIADDLGPRCNDYGAHLMCEAPAQDIDVTTTSATTTTTSMWTTSYCEYMYDSGLCDDGDYGYYYYDTTTTAAYTTDTTAHDDSCYRHHAGMDEFKSALERGIKTALRNDIYTYSAVPGTITNGAVRREEQWFDWFQGILVPFFEEADDSPGHPSYGGRQCIVDKFPGNSAGNLGKDVLGSDCALDMTSIDAICHNLKRFFQWAYKDCNGGCGYGVDCSEFSPGHKAPQGQRKLDRLETRCQNILRIKEEIHGITAKSLVDDIERTNKDIIAHNIKMQKDGKAAGRYGPRSQFHAQSGKKSKKEAKKAKKAKKPSKKNKNKKGKKN